MYSCTYFGIKELVCPEWYTFASKRGGIDKLWVMLDERILRTIDMLRRKFGPIIVNNWGAGGPRKESGLRIFDTPTGAVCSPHKVGKAVDFLCRNHSPEEIYEAFVSAGGTRPGFRDRTDAAAEPWRLLARFEYFPGMTWTHIDVMDALGNKDGSIRVIAG